MPFCLIFVDMQHKTFIVGLPRTGTSSLCVAALELGYKTAHTAYTTKSFLEAEVIADTPIYSDYKCLIEHFPQSQLILLERKSSLWIPSIQRLLKRMSCNLFTDRGGFNDTVKRAYLTVFPNLNENNIEDRTYLWDCYLSHRNQVETVANAAGIKLIKIDMACTNVDFLKNVLPPKGEGNLLDVPHLNIGGKITAWSQIKHRLKVESTMNGKATKDQLLYQFRKEINV
ncbi:hypothetical protein PALB_29380 [Pseudoalteromonas luteoviolacea B = ATCC 29581]|nr:hypothetical protein PALB_29380 [Pseudoalteromonas luteoviolacea B = ATCC 29581]